MSQQPTPYNQVDFVVKAPRFRIVFSYMDDKGVAFVREYLLRLLKLLKVRLKLLMKDVLAAAIALKYAVEMPKLL